MKIVKRKPTAYPRKTINIQNKPQAMTKTQQAGCSGLKLSIPTQYTGQAPEGVGRSVVSTSSYRVQIFQILFPPPPTHLCLSQNISVHTDIHKVTQGKLYLPCSPHMRSAH